MYKIWQKDGLSRQQRIQDTAFSGRISLLNEDFHSLVQKAYDFASQIIFYNLSDKPEGKFSQLFEKSIFFTLNHIRGIDLQKEEKDFLSLLENDFYAARHKEEKIIKKLLGYLGLFDNWARNTSFFEANGCKLYFRADLMNQIITNLREPVSHLMEHCKQKHNTIGLPELSSIWKTNNRPSEVNEPFRFYRSIFYRFQNSIGVLQNHHDLYEKEIYGSGFIDPAVGLLAAFLSNHNKIVSEFNNRWKQYPGFYLETILEATPAKAEPDFACLQLIKAPSTKYLLLEKDFEFQSPEGIKFRNTGEYIVSNCALKEIRSLYEERNPEIEPNNELGYATSLLKYDLSQLIDRRISEDNQPVLWFGQKTGKTQEDNYAPVGLMIRSWSFFLREGERDLTLRFIPSRAALENFSQLTDRLCNGNDRKQEIIYQLLHNIFCVEISTETGWEQVRSTAVEFVPFRKEMAFVVSLHFSEDFPAIVPLPGETGEFLPPSLRITINPNTWMFPYSWLKFMEFEKIKIESGAYNLRNVQVYSELGRQDISMPFYPFGAMPRKGAWMAVGCYEMALKKITAFDLHVRWNDLPDDDYGFAAYYRQYPGNIDNCSFRITPQILKNRKWQPLPGNNEDFLFSTGTINGKAGTAPKAKLSAESCFNTIKPEEVVPSLLKEEEYYFNMFSRSGFFRFTLTRPPIGFGHSEYQKLISDVLLQKVRSKKAVEMPNLPVAPRIEQISVDYQSEGELTLSDNPEKGNQVFHIHPFGLVPLNNSSNLRQFSFVPSWSGQGNLLLGFDGVEGGETIRLYFDLQAREKEIDKTQFPEIKWYSGNGFNWEILPVRSVLLDETRNLVVSGIIEISIPARLPDLTTAMDNLYWLKASVENNIGNLSEVLGVYQHVIKTERIITEGQTEAFSHLPAFSLTETGHKIPGLEEIIQLKDSFGGRLPENQQMMQVRLAERVSHRNRAVNARDYERLVLENFPTVQKAKCFPGTDSKSDRPGVVTLAIIEKDTCNRNFRTPKSGCQLLLDIEDFLQKHSSVFAVVDVINPVYEFLQVRCKVTLAKNLPEGYYLQKLNKEINSYLAFWEESNDVPVFGHLVSVIELANYIRSRDYVRHIRNFSLVHLSEEHENYYELKELEEFEPVDGKTDQMRAIFRIMLNDEEIQAKELEPVRASKPWGILVPMSNHQLAGDGEDLTETIGIDELEIGNTFVIQ